MELARSTPQESADARQMRLALRLAHRGYGRTSPNPIVGAVLIRNGRVFGRGWHHRAGEPHAEIEAIRDAHAHGRTIRGSTLYVTLEPCSTQGRTPACCDAIIREGIARVVAGATDPNPQHRGRGLTILRKAGIEVCHGVLGSECDRLNEAFNHWIVRRTPFVTIKAAMTLDGKIATAAGESKWITGDLARAYGMRLRQGADGVLVGINTVLADNPSLTFRKQSLRAPQRRSGTAPHRLNRFVLDSLARTPLDAQVVSDRHPELTTIIVSEAAPARRVAALARRVRVLVAPLDRSARLHRVAGARPTGKFQRHPSLDLRWLMEQLGSQQITSLLVEGGGEVNSSFLFSGLAHRIAFFYAPKILGGRGSRPGVGGAGAETLRETLDLRAVEWRQLGPDLLLTARVVHSEI